MVLLPLQTRKMRKIIGQS